MVNPATLTFNEYYKLVNDKEKFHPDTAYNTTLKRLNANEKGKTNYPKLLQHLRINGLEFEIRKTVEDKGWDASLAIFDEDGQKVATVQDEWGCMLVMVAEEFRGFGFGPILIKIARTMDPLKPSGGFTQSGYNNFVKVYREMVRDALKSGFYTQSVRSGRMTAERVKAIIDSAKLNVRPQHKQRNLNSNNPKDWLLYVGGYGDFILYDKKLKDELDANNGDNPWIKKMIKGLMLVREHDEKGLIVQFGGDTDKIKTFMITCAISYCANENLPLYIDSDDRKFVDPKYGSVAEEANYESGKKRYIVTPINTIATSDILKSVFVKVLTSMMISITE
jgi:hypothetical protein